MRAAATARNMSLPSFPQPPYARDPHFHENADGGVTTVSLKILRNGTAHIGANAAMLQYSLRFPLPNDQSVGDGLNFSGYRFLAAPSSARYVYTARLDYRLD